MLYINFRTYLEVLLIMQSTKVTKQYENTEKKKNRLIRMCCIFQTTNDYEI